MNEYLSKTPFDLYDLSVLELVVKHGSFTKTAQILGLTQSAVTRRIQTIEQRVGVSLLERTTRRVQATPAGKFLLSEAALLINGVQDCFSRLNSQFVNGRKSIRIGISNSLCMSHLPGLFRIPLKKQPQLQFEISHKPGVELLSLLCEDAIDIAVLCPPKRIPKHTKIVHSFKDTFTLITGTDQALEKDLHWSGGQARKRKWLESLCWLLPDVQTNTGHQINQWLQKQKIHIEPTMTLDSFDLIINLVSLNIGVGIVPIRALATYGSRKKVIRLQHSKPFTRDLGLMTRSGRKLPQHIVDFIEQSLF